MTLSLRASAVICGLIIHAAPTRAEPAVHAVPRAGAVAMPAEGGAAQAGSQGLPRRIERLLPVLMNSLAAARREREDALIRCFDRAVSELHGLRRQAAYHADRSERAVEPGARDRHQRALTFLAQRVEELAHSGETCFTGGVVLSPGTTRVDVVFSPR
ncbi:MAG TPA: hypothetical protein VFZ61_26205 [Polyangiales bacterium]